MNEIVSHCYDVGCWLEGDEKFHPVKLILHKKYFDFTETTLPLLVRRLISSTINVVSSNCLKSSTDLISVPICFPND